MNTVNYGNQKITLSYFNVGTSKSFNQRNYKILPMGIYSKMQYDTDKNLSFSNGNVTKLNSTTARISPFIAEVRDFENNISIRIETQENIDVILTPSEPYLMIKFEYGASQQNYASIIRSSYAMLVEDYIVIAKGIFDSSNVLQSTFDYSRRHNIDFTFPFVTYNDFPLKLLAQEPMTNKVNVLGGIVSMASQSYSIPNTEITFTMPTSSKRIDLLYISDSGTIEIVEGVENASPIIPDYENKLVIAEIHLDVTKGIIDGSDIIQVISNYRQAINSSIPTFDQILINDSPTEDNHAATKQYVDNLLEGLDWQESVKSFLDLVTSEPSTRNVGDRYIAIATGTSNLTGTSITENHIYQWTNVPNNHWIDITPDLHTTVSNEDNGRAYNFNGTIWVLNSSTVDHNYLAGLQGGTSNQYYHLTSSEYTNIFVRNVHTTDNITEGSTNLFYTEGRVSANTDVAANTSHRNITNGNPHGTLATQISDFDTEVSNNTDVANATTHIGRTDNPHTVTKTQVGLGNVDDVKQIPYDQLGVANGVATLDASGIIYENQLPIAVRESLHYIGAWNASSGSPPSASPNNGEFWIVNTNGSYSLGGIDDWKATDWACYINATWRKIDNTDKITSVNGYEGIVELDTDDIDEGSSNLYFTDLRVTNATTVVDHENRLDYIESPNHVISYQDLYLGNNNLQIGELLNEQTINGIPTSQLSNFTLDYNSSTRILTLTHISNWYYYCNGEKYNVTETLTFDAHATTDNSLFFFYFDENGVIQAPTTVAWNLLTDTQIALVYYVTSNDGGSALGTLFDERHGIVMSAQTHNYLHNVLSTQYISGGDLTGFTLDTDTVDAVTYAVSEVQFKDEDLHFISGAIADGGPYQLIYYDSTRWSILSSSIPYFINSGTNNIQYNNPATGLVDITTNNRWVNYYLFVTNTYDATKRIFIIPGQSTHTSIDGARNETASNLDLSGFPFKEVAFFKKITLKYESGNSTATGRAEIDEITDIRYSPYTIISGGGSGVTSHAALTERDIAGQHPISAIYGTAQYKIPYMGATGLEDSIYFMFDGSTLSAPNINIRGELLGGSLFLGRTVNSQFGVVYKEEVRWLHDFHHPTGQTQAPTGRNIFLGEEAGNFTMGSTATLEAYSSYNIGIGYKTLVNLTLGYINIAIGTSAMGSTSITGHNNIAIGSSSLYLLTSGIANTSMGRNSGSKISTGLYNVFLGADSGNDAAQKADVENSIAIGYNTYTTKDNQIVLGNSSIVETLLRGNIGINTILFGTDAAGVIGLLNGTTPTTSPSNTVQLYATSGNLYVREENGGSNVSGRIWHSGNDGALSGLDADTLDGLQGSEYVTRASLTEKPSSDAPNTYPIGFSQFPMSDGTAGGWPCNLGLVQTVYHSTTRATQKVTQKETGAEWSRDISGTANVWGSFLATFSSALFERAAISAGGRLTAVDTTAVNVDVTGKNWLDLSPSETATIDILGFTGGLAGQFLFITKSSSADTVIFRHNSGSGTQPLILTDSQDVTYGSGKYGMWVAMCYGSNWRISALLPSTSAATGLTGMSRDSAGRTKVADPAADTDVDTQGARNAAIAAATSGGLWTPTVTLGTSVSSVTVTTAQYSKSNNIVFFSIQLSLTSGASSNGDFYLSLPISSNFSNDYNANGNGLSSNVNIPRLFVSADTTNNRLFISSIMQASQTATCYIIGSYTII
jgi:hypothetical protein